MTVNAAVSVTVAPADINTDAGQLRLSGAWTLTGVYGLQARLHSLRWPEGRLELDGADLQALDTSGALFLLRTIRSLQRRGRTITLTGLRTEHRALLGLVAERGALDPPPAPPSLGWLAALGRRVVSQFAETVGFFSFVGATSLALMRTVARPRKLRGQALAAVLQSAGVQALPIVGLMAFLLGGVIAYQGGLQLKTYGANIFIVELVSLTMLRELAPLIAAIMVAGRTGSAFTAQIGTMRVTEEVDALNTIGIDPLDMLVLPKLLALLIALPLLTVFADLASVFGGMVMASLLLDVSFGDFINRIPQAVSVTSFVVGVIKAPVFAAIIAMIGCYQGFLVSASAESVGRQTTASVVQAIFFVIVADAAFSIVLGLLGI